MHTPPKAEISAARDVVLNPAQFADQPALRENAWRTLVEERGGYFAARHLPVMTHAQPGRPARGVAAQFTRDMAPDRATIIRPSLADCVADALPATRAAIARRLGRSSNWFNDGGSAA